MATEVSSAPSMPQLQSVQKAMAIPTVGAAVGQVGALYTKVKGELLIPQYKLAHRLLFHLQQCLCARSYE